jgi:hypothetical protein
MGTFTQKSTEVLSEPPVLAGVAPPRLCGAFLNSKQEQRTQLVALCVLSALVLSIMGLKLSVFVDFPFPRCHFRDFVGVACPLCGTTRLGTALAAGEILIACRANPLLFAGCLVMTMTALMALAAPGRFTQLFRAARDLISRPAMMALVSLLFLLNWFYVIWVNVQ